MADRCQEEVLHCIMDPPSSSGIPFDIAESINADFLGILVGALALAVSADTRLTAFPPKAERPKT